MVISVIVSTYNRLDALRVVLRSLAAQTERDFEILVADDGSRPDTGAAVRAFAAECPVPLRHVWHEDLGFRLSHIRNRASAQAKGGYLVFLDGDCAVQPDFVAQHRRLAEPGYMVTGSRILLEQELTRELCQADAWDFPTLRRRAPAQRLAGQINKFLPLYFRLPGQAWRHYRDFVWRRIKGCNLACWAADARAIGGFSEDMTGWGHEDADFVFRLHTHGVRRKSGAWATEVLHLWHRMASADKGEANRVLLQNRIDAWRAQGR